MASTNFNIQWANQNSQRSFPLTDASDSYDKTGTIRIPDSFMLAMDFPVHAGLNVHPEKFFIHTLGIYPTGYSVVLGYNDGTTAPPMVANTNISRIAHQENNIYAIAGINDFSDSTGTLMIGQLADIDALPPGVYYFNPANTNLETDVISPMLRTVNGLDVS